MEQQPRRAHRINWTRWLGRLVASTALDNLFWMPGRIIHHLDRIGVAFFNHCGHRQRVRGCSRRTWNHSSIAWSVAARVDRHCVEERHAGAGKRLRLRRLPGAPPTTSPATPGSTLRRRTYGALPPPHGVPADPAADATMTGAAGGRRRGAFGAVSVGRCSRGVRPYGPDLVS